MSLVSLHTFTSLRQTGLPENVTSRSCRVRNAQQANKCRQHLFPLYVFGSPYIQVSEHANQAIVGVARHYLVASNSVGLHEVTCLIDGPSFVSHMRLEVVVGVDFFSLRHSSTSCDSLRVWRTTLLLMWELVQ